MCQSPLIRNFVFSEFEEIYRKIDFDIFENIELNEIFAKAYNPISEFDLSEGEVLNLSSMKYDSKNQIGKNNLSFKVVNYLI